MRSIRRFAFLAPGFFLGSSFALIFMGGEWTDIAVHGAETGGISISRPKNDPNQTRETSVLWDETPVRKAVADLEQQSGWTIWLDRRIDPAFPISGAFQDAPADLILQETFFSDDRRVSRLPDDLLFAAPKSTVFLIRTLLTVKRQELREALSAADQKKWLTVRSVAWEHLTEPKAILEKIADSMKLEIRDLSKLPHDLWPERAPMDISGLDAVLLILVQFDLTLEFTSSGAQIVPLDPKSILISRTYSASDISEDQLAEVQKLPGTRTVRKGSKLLVRGTLEAHEALAGGSASGTSRKSGTAKQSRTPQNTARSYGLKPGETVSGTVKGPFLPYIKALCSQYGLTLSADESELRSAGIDPSKHVEVTADKASLEELFSMMAEEAGCDAELNGPTLTIRPAK